MRLLARAGSIFDRTIDTLTVVATIILVFVMLSVCAEVVLRYFLNRPLIWVVQVSENSLLYIAFLGAAWVLRREGHVRMDIVVNYLGSRTQVFLGIITSIIGAFVFLIVTWYGAQATWDHFVRGLFIPKAINIPNAYILVIIPVGSFLFFIQFLRRAYKYLVGWRVTPGQEQGL